MRHVRIGWVRYAYQSHIVALGAPVDECHNGLSSNSFAYTCNIEYGLCLRMSFDSLSIQLMMFAKEQEE